MQAAAHVERAPVVDRVRLHGLAQIRLVLVQPVAFARQRYVRHEDKFGGAGERRLREHERVADVHFDHFDESGAKVNGHREAKQSSRR